MGKRACQAAEYELTLALDAEDRIAATQEKP